MKLEKIIKTLRPIEVVGETTLEFNSIKHDSRLIQPGDIFVAIPGLKQDGSKFIPQAVARGAVAVISEKSLDLPVTVIQVENARRALALSASCYYGHPARHLKLMGITGTNGKTTISYLIKAILEKAGQKTGLIGSITNIIGDDEVTARYTTPDALLLYALLARMAEQKIETVIIEVSSHALALDRIFDCVFQAAILTNLTHDHLDFHKDFANYKLSKAKLFSQFLVPDGRKIINQDDAFGRELMNEASAGQEVISYGLSKQADVYAERIDLRFDGTSFYLVTKNLRQHIELPLVGLFNVYNTLAAIAYCLSEGIDIEQIVEAVEEFPGVPGRLQLVECGQPFKVIVDYAHTPDSLEQVLKTIKALTRGQVITVFGCTGDRDTSKRQIMGSTAAQWSDYFYITSDDPHGEEPMAIIKEVEKGAIDRGRLRRYDYLLEIDRYKAIEMALKKAGKGDVVLIAGKGHESVQIFKDKTVEFSDEKVVREILSNVAKK